VLGISPLMARLRAWVTHLAWLALDQWVTQLERLALDTWGTHVGFGSALPYLGSTAETARTTRLVSWTWLARTTSLVNTRNEWLASTFGKLTLLGSHTAHGKHDVLWLARDMRITRTVWLALVSWVTPVHSGSHVAAGCLCLHGSHRYGGQHRVTGSHQIYG
jgi:hypothetical protein